MSLDLRVGQAAHAVMLMQRALHEPTAWTMVYGGEHHPAQRTLEDDGVVFSARVPLSEGDGFLSLAHDGVVLATRPHGQVLGDTVFAWTVAMTSPSGVRG